jgi:hypothetical protein
MKFEPRGEEAVTQCGGNISAPTYVDVSAIILAEFKPSDNYFIALVVVVFQHRPLILETIRSRSYCFNCSKEGFGGVPLT